MTDLTLVQARQQREDILLDDFIDKRLDVLLSAKTVGPEARRKLRNLLKHYAKKRHPFRACVRDNMKRFGPGRTEAICATLKDIIRGTTKWRGNRALDRGSAGIAGLADAPAIDEETETLLMSLADRDLEDLLREAMAYV